MKRGFRSLYTLNNKIQILLIGKRVLVLQRFNVTRFHVFWDFDGAACVLDPFPVSLLDSRPASVQTCLTTRWTSSRSTRPQPAARRAEVFSCALGHASLKLMPERVAAARTGRHVTMTRRPGHTTISAEGPETALSGAVTDKLFVYYHWLSVIALYRLGVDALASHVPS